MCRHYAQLLAFLYRAAQLATGAAPHCHLISVAGMARSGAISGHAWNWWIDEAHGRIVALDLTSADWRMDRSGDPSILNAGFEGAGLDNVSAFLSTIISS